MNSVLIISPQRVLRNALSERLRHEEYQVEAVGDQLSGVKLVESRSFDSLILDPETFSSLTPKHKELFSSIPLIVATGDDTASAAIAALRSGAADYFPSPIDMNMLLASLKRTVSDENRTETQGGTAQQLQPRKKNGKTEEIVGNSISILHVKKLIEKVAPSEARVLVIGANGTGKELVARWLHDKSNRAEGPFVEVNCAAIPSELIESELFGHEKGAFTSAIKQRKGKFEQAHGGTLFLDEVGDMSLSAQAKVLRALQESRISRVGSDKDIEVNVRVVAATNKNLKDEIEKRRFREDLYHRLSVIVITVPPLCQRIDDIPLLVDRFLKRVCAEYSIPVKKIEKEALAELSKMEWSGNIRELQNVIERLIILSGEAITLTDVRAYAASV